MNVVCFEWSVMNGLFWKSLFWSDTSQNKALQLCIITTTNVLGKTCMFIFLEVFIALKFFKAPHALPLLQGTGDPCPTPAPGYRRPMPYPCSGVPETHALPLLRGPRDPCPTPALGSRRPMLYPCSGVPETHALPLLRGPRDPCATPAPGSRRQVVRCLQMTIRFHQNAEVTCVWIRSGCVSSAGNDGNHCKCGKCEKCRVVRWR